MKLYTNKEKQILGRYIRYMRKTKSIKLKEIYSRYICGHSTYHNIEKGIVKKNDEIYDLLLNFYHIEYNLPTKYLEELEDWFKNLYQVCFEYHIEEMRNLIHMFKLKYNEYKNHIYIHELYETVDIIEAFYSNNSLLNKEDIEKMLPIIELFDNSYGSILIEVCEQSNFLFVCDYDIANLLSKHLNDTDFLREYWLGRNFRLNERYKSAIDIYSNLLNQHVNFVRETRLLLDLHSIYRDIDKNNAKKILRELEIRVNDYRLCDELKRIILYNLGMYYYLNQSYEKAIEYYQREIQIQPRIPSIIFLSSSYSHTNLEFDTLFNIEIDKSHSSYPYYLYFEKKYNKVSYVDLEDYILNEMMEKLKTEKYELPYWSMFEYEMRTLNTKTSNYKKLNTYLKLRDKYLKNGD